MADEYLVFVADEEGQDRGDVSFFTTADEAASHAESLLDAGYDQSRIRVFSSKEMDVQVSHRPVVSFADGADTGTSQDSGTPESTPAAGDEGAGEVAGVKDGVRLSSMFKTDD